MRDNRRACEFMMRFISPTTRHYLFVGLAGLSLFLAVVVTILWAYGRTSIISYQLLSTAPTTLPTSYPSRWFEAYVSSEDVYFQHSWIDKPPTKLGTAGRTQGNVAAPAQRESHWRGLRWAKNPAIGVDSSGNTWDYGTLSYLVVPLPYFIVILLVLPIYRLYRSIRYGDCWRWKGPGFCRVCGYDLRATPERCPECGAIPKAAI